MDPVCYLLTVTCISRCATQLPHILQLWQIPTATSSIQEDKQMKQPIAKRVFSSRHRLYVTYVSLSQSAAKTSRLQPETDFRPECSSGACTLFTSRRLADSCCSALPTHTHTRVCVPLPVAWRFGNFEPGVLAVVDGMFCWMRGSR